MRMSPLLWCTVNYRKINHELSHGVFHGFSCWQHIMSAAKQPVQKCLLIVLLGCIAAASLRAEEKFDLSLLENHSQVSREEAELFNGDNDILPGKYNLRILINDHEVAQQELVLALHNGHTEPLFACRDLQEWGMHLERCTRAQDFLSTWIPEAKTEIDMAENTLSITVPQLWWSQPDLYDIAPSWKWDNGINAAFINYDLYAQRYENHGSSNDLYGNLTNGINLFGWRLRNSGFFSAPDMAHPRYQSSSSWLAYDIDRLRSTLTAGEFYTSGSLFRSMAMRGVSLASNTAMLPNNQRSYVPAIIGSVSANATVIVKQGGYTIATRQIPPGAFAIKDIPASSAAGDIEVTIIEASGKQQHFTQPFNTTSFQVPLHSLRYALNIGQSRQYSAQRLAEGSLMYGLSNTFTLLEGLQYAEGYRNYATGIGANVRWLGGVNLLLNHSSSRQQLTRSGNQLQFGLNRFLALTDSYIYASLAHRFNRGYQEFNDAMRPVDANPTSGYRDKYSLQLSQHIQEASVALNYSEEIDWNGDRYRSWQSSLNLHPGHVMLQASFSRRYAPGRAGENVLSLSVSIPLGRERNHYLDLSQSYGVGNNSRLALTGTAGEQQQFNYSLGAAKSGAADSYDASASYNASIGTARAAWSRSMDAQQWLAGARGSVVMHHHGVTLGQYLNESAALIHTQRVQNVGIENARQVATDRWGNALVPALVPYYYNELTPTLDRRHIHTIKVDDTVHRLVPRQGAIVEMEVNASHQQQHYARITQENQQPLPFGALLYDANDGQRGVISAGGVTAMDIYQLQWPLHINLADRRRCIIDPPAGAARQQKVWHLICHA